MSPRAWKYRRRCRCVLERCHLQSPCLNKNSVQNARACIPPWAIIGMQTVPRMLSIFAAEHVVKISFDLMIRKKTFTHGTNNMASWLTTTKNRAPDRCTKEARAPRPLSRAATWPTCTGQSQWISGLILGKLWANQGKTMGNWHENADFDEILINLRVFPYKSSRSYGKN